MTKNSRLPITIYRADLAEAQAAHANRYRQIANKASLARDAALDPDTDRSLLHQVFGEIATDAMVGAAQAQAEHIGCRANAVREQIVELNDAT